ncbi:hypothetical protein DFA_11173 [Cavenderia fasciculata]|uniref:GH18 domain-containing protein n=1 Tax=Cavenderia fasciculata TaxID=261658 RepID=F4QFA5_CACFS|nr:uncharacterized protein DFA_11173 [Cavenderia fasciculata]EGG13412.1 hypothetical protein DFA_11173 [Cavenderia fasciculata]|eukprot:XP_004350116.1 hypothetical protein DFA_11173 [Cavenderia fasciculata]
MSFRQCLYFDAYHCTNNPNLPMVCQTAPLCGSIVSTPTIDYNEKMVFSYIAVYDIDYYFNTTNQASLLLQNNSVIITYFGGWTDLDALALLICVAHLNNAQVHHWTSIDCGGVYNGNYPCVEYMANNGYIDDIALVTQMGADGYNIDMEGSTEYVNPSTFKNNWMKSIYNYAKSVQDTYIVSIAVPCDYDQSQWNTDYTDYYFVMCYDMGGNDGVLQSNAPYSSVRRGISNWKKNVNHPGMVIVGLPLYAYFQTCNPMSDGIYGATCSYTPTPNWPPSVGNNQLYQIVNSAFMASDGITSTSQTPYVNVIPTSSAMTIIQYQYESPSSIYQKIKGLGIGGVGIYRADLLIGLPNYMIRAYYTSATSMY